MKIKNWSWTKKFIYLFIFFFEMMMKLAEKLKKYDLEGELSSMRYMLFMVLNADIM